MILAGFQTTTTSVDAGVGIGILIVYGIGAIISLGLFILAIMCVVDFIKHSDQAWQASGQNKTTALVVIILSFVCCGLLSLYYWFSIKPAVEQAEQGGAAGAGGYAV